MVVAVLSVPAGVVFAQEPVRASARDSAVRADSVRPPFRRVVVTPAMVASAFSDTAARTLLLRARAARMVVDSALRSYEARTYRRATAGLGLRAGGPERVLYRQESSGLVHWQRDVGAKVRVTGFREASPIYPGIVRSEVGPVIPYFPGKDALWLGGGVVVREEVDEGRVMHPLANGAEAYYRYATGDSVQMLLPDKRRISLRELRVTPRRPDWNTIIGSFWFDEATAQMVKAVYRLAAPADLSTRMRRSIQSGQSNVPWVLRQIAFPIHGDVGAITVESGLYEGRFWLPRQNTATGIVTMNFARLPLVLEEKFTYLAVNGDAPLAPLAATPLEIRWDSIGNVTPQERRAIIVARNDRARAERLARRSAQCAKTGTWTQRSVRFARTLETEVETPCDTAALAHSPDLPEKLFEPGERPFALLESATDLGAVGIERQAAFAPQRPTYAVGLTDGMLRYNRVEGLSAGIGVREELGLGYRADARVRIGTGDGWPNAELGVARATGARTMRLGVYARTVSINDWGAPFSTGESLVAAIAGRDEGFYARTWGADFTIAPVGSDGLRWRLFVEGQGNAPLTTRWSAIGGSNDPEVIANVVATEGTWAGAALRGRLSAGADPLGVRWSVETRTELAGGTTRYARSVLEGNASAALGSLYGAISLSGGGAVGTVPPQRWWFLGGARTVRGQVAGTVAGATFWLARAELGPTWTAIRPVVFYDAGSAGPDFTTGVRPISGAGIGVSFLDGVLRLDVARGIFPRTSSRVDLTIDAKF